LQGRAATSTASEREEQLRKIKKNIEVGLSDALFSASLLCWG
jgi:hypothetical protein